MLYFFLDIVSEGVLDSSLELNKMYSTKARN